MTRARLLDPAYGEDLEKALCRFVTPKLMASDAPGPRMCVDVTETDAAYTVRADVPGVRWEDIQVRIDGTLVQIEARHRGEPAAGARAAADAAFGRISHSFSLGQDVDATRVQAEYADGVLQLELPKQVPGAVARPRELAALQRH